METPKTEKYLQLRAEARLKLKNADHLLTMTYPLVGDNKLLLAAADNLGQALSASMLSVLYYERMMRRIPPFHDDTDSALNAFEAGVMTRYRIPRDYPALTRDMLEIAKLHQESSVEFSRKEKYVIASGTYKLKELTPQLLKSCLEKAKIYIQEMEILVSKDESLSRRGR